MPFAVRVVAALAFLSAAAPVFAQSDEPPHTLGACGGVMTGYDGRPYSCGAERKPACDPNGSRCVCLERRECGGRQNDPF